MASAKFVDISIVGDKKLQAKLRRLDLKVQRKIVRKALRDAAKPVLADAKARAPVDTGLLKRSLQVRAATRQRRGTFGVFIQTKGRDFFNIQGDDPYFYPAIVEFGSLKHALPARSYLRAAVDANRSATIFRIRTEIAGQIKAEARR